jgi:hypothetical protein
MRNICDLSEFLGKPSDEKASFLGEKTKTKCENVFK